MTLEYVNICCCHFFVVVFIVIAAVIVVAVGKVYSLYRTAHSLHAHSLCLVILNSPIPIIF